jgi:hypothetical protein
MEEGLTKTNIAKSAKSHKLRKLTSNNRTGDSYGITIPKHISKEFIGVYFTPHKANNAIILMSGAKP